MEGKPKLNSIGFLKIRKGQSGIEYMTGMINGVNVVCFLSKKRDKIDWQIFKSERQEGGTPQVEAAPTISEGY